MTVEGIILGSPMERHTHSRWLTLRTAQERLVRVVVANSAPAANWLEPGDLVRVHGRVMMKLWADGPHQTLSAHEDIKMIRGRLSMR